MTHLKRHLSSTLALGVAIGSFLGTAAAPPHSRAQDAKTTASTVGGSVDRPVERAAIETASQSFVEAYSKGEVDRVAVHLSEGAELISDEAPPLRGRDAIRQALASYFAENPPKTIVREVDSVRFTSKHSAVEEGNLKVSVGSEAPKNMKYSLHLIDEDGKWLITSIQEWPSEVGELLDLEWLIGSWEAKGPDAEFRTTFEWFGEQAFIRCMMTVRQKDRTGLPP